MTDDPWAHWQSRLNGADPGCEDGVPQWGFYRDGKDQPIQIWQEDGKWVANVGVGDPPKYITDELRVLEIWGFCHARPVTEADYETVVAGGAWRDRSVVASEARAAAPETPGDVFAWVERLRAALPGTIEDAVTAEKVGQLSAAAGRLETTAEDLRKKEKEPHLKASREVDAKWKPAVAAAEALKREIKDGPLLTWQKREKQRLEAEQRAIAEAARKAADEARASGDPLAAAQAEEEAAVAARKAAEPVKPKAVHGQNLRARRIAAVADIRAALRWYADRNEDVPYVIVEAVRRDAQGRVELGAEVPGISVTVETRMT